MATKHCYMHNAVTSHDVDGVKGHALACEVEPRYQYRKREKPSHKGLLKAAGGPTNIEFGSFMPDEEAQALIKRRPGSEHKVREMSGNNIFEGPYPIKEDCGGIGSDMTGRCPPRQFSSSKARDLKGHNIFEAFTCPYEPPKPPPVRPYEPAEMPLPPDKLRRNPTKLSSHFNFGGPVCIEPMMPPNQSAWAKQKMLYGSMDDLDKDSFPKPFVSKLKARELAGQTNLFGTPPRHSLPCTPVPERCDVVYGGVENDIRQKLQLVQKTKMQALHGHDAVFLNSNACCPGKPTPLSHRKAQELRGNDIFAGKTQELKGYDIFAGKTQELKGNDIFAGKTQELKGNDIFASTQPDPRRCHKASKPSSRASSRQSSGGRSSRASSKCSDYPSLKHM